MGFNSAFKGLNADTMLEIKIRSLVAKRKRSERKLLWEEIRKKVVVNCL